MAELAHRVALVTGASSGIGEATARTLLDRGLHGVRAARGRSTAWQELRALGIHALALDVTDETSMVAAVDRILQRPGTHRCPGQQRRLWRLRCDGGRATSGGPASVRRQPVRPGPTDPAGPAGHACAPQRPDRQRGLRRRSHLRARWAPGTTPPSSRSRASAMHSRLELAPHGIQVVIIEPGEIRTAWGGIAADSLRATSGSGPYAAQARAVAAVLERSLGAGTGSPPEVVAEAIGRAVTARRPKSRYAVGRGARSIILARRLLPDRVFDRVMRRLFRVLSAPRLRFAQSGLEAVRAGPGHPSRAGAAAGSAHRGWAHGSRAAARPAPPVGG